MDLLAILFEALLVVLLADFVSGVGHWLEDSYGAPDTPWVGRSIIVPNLEHHVRPRAFLARSWWESCGDLVSAGALLIAAAWALDLLTWHVVLFAVVGSQANQIHKWAHQNPAEKGALVDRLQRLRILQTPREHGRHHQGSKDSHYCTITNLLNAPLERVRFWRRLETVLERGFGLRKRIDPVGGWTVAALHAAAAAPRTHATLPLGRRVQATALRPLAVRRLARALGLQPAVARR
jgi:plasmanylethanolamine desaturase